MTKFTKLALAALLGMAVMTSTASADAAKGQKIYSKKLKKACGMTGAEFAKKHTQDEWTAIIDGDKLAAEITTICGENAKVKAKKLKHVGDFAKEFASDSGNVPSC
ncbi:hypothetical protein MNB_SV-3-35 [hydrothermal vent metagenome]|uniref:Cytochrome C n=1 Tax=hydrothermal vent metagenome TaxID=652676 RepID=A0A1W1BMN1_9ZZZZ